MQIYFNRPKQFVINEKFVFCWSNQTRLLVDLSKRDLIENNCSLETISASAQAFRWIFNAQIQIKDKVVETQ